MNNGKEANPWNWSKTHPDTKFLTQRIISMEEQTWQQRQQAREQEGCFCMNCRAGIVKGKGGIFAKETW